MRQIVLDTETTGLEPALGHRIIEIGCVELVNRRLTQRRFHQYLCPDREIDGGALEVHGIDNEFLKDKPRFKDIVGDFLDFVRGAELIIHNAPFDTVFIDCELERSGLHWGRLGEHCKIVDTLALARELHPGQKNSLDALCRRYGVDNSQRELHGALLDAEILADVYLAMTGGQTTLELYGVARGTAEGPAARGRISVERPPLRVIRANAQEQAAHARRLDALDAASGGPCVWRRCDT
ncbi:MAG: DNA polymerase III subunit epsilon [Gammaproteobacteria bacterium]|nr:DNA polymerase III subunit epsilon [Gammaproteobacteria bacterium]NIR82859.1 DNA polymerase III subunit epsilon [Gammaproteobacteria bacterium]NIR89968.1 DNA polymerase III subunit epsilon [Gammaproteobacteria bacterium]NIU04017.1 DNA polymerase III subunit epsilon [Gammaproteobacteria bacterium]NIV51337.1 DNA polymerase III subunit epsilon [Gammaproteobacteria bacterium]